MNRAPAIAAIAFTTLCAGCDRSPSSPSASAVAVVDERFHVSLTSKEQSAAARAALAGGRANIPIGRIVSGTEVNTGWSWHLEDVSFVESTIELCDGRPSDVERQGTGFGGGRYCPWAATIVEIADTSPATSNRNLFEIWLP